MNLGLNLRTLCSMFVSLIAMLVVNEAYAQTESSRYPWDKRSEACLKKTNESSAACLLNNWSSFDETIQRLTLLYRTEQFSLLERALAEIVPSNVRFTSGRPAASAAYSTFRRLMAAPGVNPTEKDRIARWRAAIPQSYFVTFAEARFLYANAWNTRGSGYAGSVSNESWELFVERLRHAEQLLLNAPKLLKDTPLWHNLLLAISLDTDQVQSNPQSTFERAVKAWPNYYDFYEVMLTRLVPKWGGSWEQVESFIGFWTKHHATREGDSLYARLYISLRNQRVTPDETKLSWVKMKKGFVDLIARYPDPLFKNLYASYACFARDQTAFSEAMRELPKNLLMPDEWLSGHSHEACLRWAII